VTVEGRLDAPPLKQLIKGVSSEGELLKAEKAWLVNSGASRSIAELELIEGKNREVRRMLGVLGFNVVRLQRIQIGRIKLGELPSGKWRTLSGAEVASLLSIATPNPQPHEH
jgi:23S rRNA pseudouridine2605 synthase